MEAEDIMALRLESPICMERVLPKQKNLTPASFNEEQQGRVGLLLLETVREEGQEVQVSANKGHNDKNRIKWKSIF
jgi:hypothetical protein